MSGEITRPGPRGDERSREEQRPRAPAGRLRWLEGFTRAERAVEPSSHLGAMDQWLNVC
jgi:hypothetical protein